MSSTSVFIENLFSFANMLGSRFAGGILTGHSGSVAAASGLPYAGENYLILSPAASSFEAEQLMEFFQSHNLPYVVPVLPETPPELILALERANVLPVHSYTAMSIELVQDGQELDNNLTPVQNIAEAEEWGQVVWAGFGGEGVATAEYLSLARHLAGHPTNKLYLLHQEGVPVSCGLLHCTEESCGLYYFATPPAFRRRGNAKKLMNALTREAALWYKDMVLLATPEGLPFYKTFGFKSLAEIPIRSISREL